MEDTLNSVLIFRTTPIITNDHILKADIYTCF